MKKLLIFLVLCNMTFADLAPTSNKTEVININKLLQDEKGLLANVKVNEELNKNIIAETKVEDKNKVEKIIDESFKLLGIKYVWGAIGPDKFDCSGFVTYVIEKSLNIKLPRISSDIASFKKDKIGIDDLQRGDLIFFDTLKKGRVTHVGIYIGDGKFIHASSGNASKKVTISDIDGYYSKVFKWAIRL